MADFCLLCECEPVNDSNWFKNSESLEMICPWCIEDLLKIVHKLRNGKK
jgi:hypothetical protein